MIRGNDRTATALLNDFLALVTSVGSFLPLDSPPSDSLAELGPPIGIKGTYSDAATALALSVIAHNCSEKLTAPVLQSLLPAELSLEHSHLSAALGSSHLQSLARSIVRYDRVQQAQDYNGDAFLNLWGVHEELLSRTPQSYSTNMTVQKAQGSYYTPQALVSSVVQLTIGAWIAEPGHAKSCPRILDPACGNGNFLLGAAQHLKQTNTDLQEGSILKLLYGFDIDPLAVYISRLRLFLLMPMVDTPTILRSTIMVTDAIAQLTEKSVATQYDCIVGNPPFLNMLRGTPEVLAQRRNSIYPATQGELGKLIGPYCDLSAVFLQVSFSALNPGGYLGLCQPISILSARDSAKIRDDVTSRGRLVQILMDTNRSFNAAVHVCVPILQRHHRLHRDADTQTSQQQPPNSTSPWSRSLVDALQLPKVPSGLSVRDGATFENLAIVTADFRDQYYWVVRHVIDLDDEDEPTSHAPVISTRLIGSGFHRWGLKKARIGGEYYQRPAVAIPLETNNDRYHEWLRSRLRPKLILATQTQTLEVACDLNGSLVPLVPILSIFPRTSDDIFHLLALLMSPALTTIALSRHLGSGLSPRALKLSAQNLRDLPLPLHQKPWDQAAALHRSVLCPQSNLNAVERESILLESAQLIDQAFGITSTKACYEWWLGKLDL